MAKVIIKSTGKSSVKITPIIKSSPQPKGAPKQTETIAVPMGSMTIPKMNKVAPEPKEKSKFYVGDKKHPIVGDTGSMQPFIQSNRGEGNNQDRFMLDKFVMMPDGSIVKLLPRKVNY